MYTIVSTFDYELLITTFDYKVCFASFFTLNDILLSNANTFRYIMCDFVMDLINRISSWWFTFIPCVFGHWWLTFDGNQRLHNFGCFLGFQSLVAQQMM